MTPTGIQKEVQAQVIKWGFMVVIALLGAGLVSVANRNVYSKPEIDYKDAAIRTEVQNVREMQGIHNAQVIKALDELKADVKELKEDKR